MEDVQKKTETFYKKANLKTEQIQSNLEPKIEKEPQLNGVLQDLDEKVKSMMERSQNLIQNGRFKERTKICKVCGKEGQGIAIRDHIEANHLEGVSLPCNVCGKEFRSRMILRKHKCI